MLLVVAFIVAIAFIVVKLLAPTSKSLGLYDYELKPFEFEKDYTKFDYKTTTIVTETPVSVQAKGGIITDGEHAGRKYSKSNDRKRSGKKAVVNVPRKADNTKRAQSTDETVPPANFHVVDIETYDTPSKSCAPSVSHRQSCSSPVEFYSSGDSPSSSDFSSILD